MDWSQLFNQGEACSIVALLQNWRFSQFRKFIPPADYFQWFPVRLVGVPAFLQEIIFISSFLELFPINLYFDYWDVLMVYKKVLKFKRTSFGNLCRWKRLLSVSLSIMCWDNRDDMDYVHVHMSILNVLKHDTFFPFWIKNRVN